VLTRLSIDVPPTQSAAAPRQELTLTFDEVALIYKSLQAVKTLGALASEDELLDDTIQLVDQALSGALWVRDELVACGWQVEVAHARKVKTVAPLAAKTDKVDARVLAELSRGELVPALWLPSLDERALRERLRRRMHLVRLRTSAKGRIFGLQTQWGIRISLGRLRKAEGLTVLERAGVPEVWRRSISECLALIDFLTPTSRSRSTSPLRVQIPPPLPSKRRCADRFTRLLLQRGV